MSTCLVTLLPVMKVHLMASYMSDYMVDLKCETKADQEAFQMEDYYVLLMSVKCVDLKTVCMTDMSNGHTSLRMTDY